MFSVERPLGRRPFFLAAVGLVLAKVTVDFAVSRAFDQPFSLLFYVSPLDNPLIFPLDAPLGIAPAYWLTIVGCALPFALVGLALTAGRLRDAGLSGALAMLFFVPFVKFPFFASLAVLPTKAPRPVTDEAGPFRSATLDTGPARRPVTERSKRLRATAFGAVAGSGVALTAMGVSVGLLRDYGVPLMVAAPGMAGFVATLVYGRLCRPTAWGVVLVTVASFALDVSVLALSAVEGFGCMFILAPLAFAEALLGALVAYRMATSISPGAIASSMLVLPATYAAAALSPLPPEAALPIESAIVVHAPADVVWRRVVAFPRLPPPTEAMFRLGIAAPLAATIDGEGPGAIRRCEFTTGTFVEPIEVWEPGRELAFSVASQPDPLREWTLYPGDWPPHLEGYLQSTRGQFVLEPLAGGSTRLVGRTWYRVHMAPAWYWRLWADRIIHAIHLRVLEHVARLAEDDVRRAPGP